MGEDIEDTNTNYKLFDKNRKLSNLYINPQLQVRIIIFMMLLNLISPLAIYLFQSSSYSGLYQAGVDNNWPSDHPYYSIITETQSKFVTALIVCAVVTSVLTIVFGLILSHKAAGPMEKLKNAFDRAAHDKQADGPIFFRKGDFFQEVAEAYNRRFEKK